MANTFSKISVLVPTRMRLERLNTMLASFEATVPHENAELVFRVDDDDEWTRELLYDRKMIVGPRGKGYGDMPQFFNEMAQEASGDVLMCGNDDMVFRTFDWPTLLLAVANDYPDGIFNLGVKTHNEKHFPFSCISWQVVEKLGFIWDPTIFWGDMYLRDVMRAFDRCIMVPDVQIDHDWAGNKPDETYYQTLPAKRRIEGSKTYWSDTGPHSTAVANAVAKLKEAVTC